MMTRPAIGANRASVLSIPASQACVLAAPIRTAPDASAASNPRVPVTRMMAGRSLTRRLIACFRHARHSVEMRFHAGTQIRMWIEQWEMSLDDVELDLPEPLEEIDPEEHAGVLESGQRTPEELEPASCRLLQTRVVSVRRYNNALCRLC